jgi:hypothetical protein
MGGRGKEEKFWTLNTENLAPPLLHTIYSIDSSNVNILVHAGYGGIRDPGLRWLLFWLDVFDWKSRHVSLARPRAVMLKIW